MCTWPLTPVLAHAVSCLLGDDLIATQTQNCLLWSADLLGPSPLCTLMVASGAGDAASPSLQEGTAPAYKYQKEGLKETGSEVEAPFLSWGKNLTTRTTTEVTYFFPRIFIIATVKRQKHCVLA